MKKLLFSLVCLIVAPVIVLAEANYDIKHYYIEAQVLENGDMDVSEAIYMKGSFNGYIRDILYRSDASDSLYNASNITDVEVYGVSNPAISFDVFNTGEKFRETDYASNGDKNKYVLSNIYDGISLKMFYQTHNSTTAFIIKYKLKDVVIMHDDVAEVKWNFIGWNYEDDIEDLQIKVYLPKTDDSDYFRIWANSQNNLIGNVEKIANEGVYAYTESLDAYDPLTVRFTFDKNLLNNALVKKHSNKSSFEEILAEEEQNAKQANERRESMKQKYFLAVGLSIAYLVALIVIWVYTYLIHDKERKPMFNLKYNREFIDDYNVEVIDYLMHKNITSNALSASIMNLIYKKNIKFEEIPSTNKKKDYLFTLVNRDNLNETENILVDFLFTKVGKDNAFSTKDLKSYASSTKTCNTFMTSYTKWKNAVIEDGKKEQFFEPKKYFMGIIMFVIGLVVSILASSLNVYSAPTVLSPVFGFAFLIYVLVYTKKTEKGIEHYSKWKAFKNFLDDFGTFELKELPEITLWDRYLVYATIFGLADKVEKAMNVHISEINVDEAYTPLFIYNHIYIGNTINSSINSAISSAQSAITSKSISSSMSSGSGFGGGFSSGGGFGGGGGGGRGF